MEWPVCKLQVCNLVFNKFAPAEYQKVNKHPKFDANFDIHRQIERFEYDITRSLDENIFLYELLFLFTNCMSQVSC